MRSSVRTSSAAPAVALDRRGQVERVLHVARRMLGRHVERVEAVPLVFDLGAVDDGEAHPREDGLHALAHDGQRVAVSERGLASRQRDVHGAGRPRAGARSLRGTPPSALSIACFSSLACRPIAFFSSGDALAICCIQEATTLFLRPRYLSRTACASRDDDAASPLESAASNAVDRRAGRWLGRAEAHRPGAARVRRARRRLGGAPSPAWRGWRTPPGSRRRAPTAACGRASRRPPSGR